MAAVATSCVATRAGLCGWEDQYHREPISEPFHFGHLVTLVNVRPSSRQASSCEERTLNRRREGMRYTAVRSTRPYSKPSATKGRKKSTARIYGHEPYRTTKISKTRDYGDLCTAASPTPSVFFSRCSLCMLRHAYFIILTLCGLPLYSKKQDSFDD